MVKKAPKHIRGEGNEQIASCLEKYVEQYILVMDEVPIQCINSGSALKDTDKDVDILTKKEHDTVVELKNSFTQEKMRDLCRQYKVNRSGNKSVLARRLLPFAPKILRKKRSSNKDSDVKF